VWLALLLMCIASYGTSFAPDLGRHFALDTGVLLGTLGAVAGVLTWVAWRPAPSAPA
jgi:hypothetical protein